MLSRIHVRNADTRIGWPFYSRKNMTRRSRTLRTGGIGNGKRRNGQLKTTRAELELELGRLAKLNKTISDLEELIASSAPRIVESLIVEIEKEKTSNHWVLLCLALETPDASARFVPLLDARAQSALNVSSQEIRDLTVKAINAGYMPIGLVGVSKADQLSRRLQNRVFKELADTETCLWLDSAAQQFEELLISVN
jgi:hypothetical protein